MNLASRIEGLTKDAKRRILVSRETAELCGDAFDFVSCGTFPVKGRAQPVELLEPRRKQHEILALLLLFFPLLALAEPATVIRATDLKQEPGQRFRDRRPAAPRTPRSTRSSARAAGRASKRRGGEGWVRMLALRFGGTGAAKPGDERR